ncbi:hypothetical protein FH971_14925 [Shewanella polaris]|uniref:Uncharacterized protein n=1 Tax=Shewanella polaris TaxID=2588449 RepID=A0A4Y5YKM5_9GAMM|nr:hypothetical protein FH971_14925 [Shewanella polaris]
MPALEAIATSEEPVIPALEVITALEKQTFDTIEQQYNIDTLLITVNDRFSQLNKKAYDIEGLKKSIISEQQRYDELIAELPKIIRAKSNIAETYKQIEASIYSVDKLTQEAEDDIKRLQTEKVEILAEYEAINKKRADKSQQLFKLKTEITNRLLADLSKPDSTFPVNINGATECSKYQSIADCLKESKSSILSNTRNESPFLNEKSVLLSYEVLDANMNMKGDLHYKVAMQFKPSYNNKIDARLNEELGLKSAMVTLNSDVPADWYINGVKIGTGKKLSHEIPLGKHGILASYQNQDKSSVETIEASGVFNYNFNHLIPTKTSKAVTTEAPKVEQNTTTQQPTAQKTKTKYSLFSDQASFELNDEDVNKSSPNKSIGYFMGLTPVNKKQTIEITNEPIEK